MGMSLGKNINNTHPPHSSFLLRCTHHIFTKCLAAGALLGGVVLLGFAFASLAPTGIPLLGAIAAVGSISAIYFAVGIALTAFGAAVPLINRCTTTSRGKLNPNPRPIHSFFQEVQRKCSAQLLEWNCCAPTHAPRAIG